VKSNFRSHRFLYCLLTSVYCLLFGCHSTPSGPTPPTPLSQLSAQQTRGHQVFVTRCSLCHYDRQADTLHGPSLISIFKKPYLHSGAPANDQNVTRTILNGRNLRPAQQDLDPADLDDLLSYLHTL
jgi:mono/diheme cytochrome c family protein